MPLSFEVMVSSSHSLFTVGLSGAARSGEHALVVVSVVNKAKYHKGRINNGY